MLYYTVLLVFWLFVGLLALWLCKEGTEIVRNALARKFPKNGLDRDRDLDCAITDTAINKTPKAWGLYGHQTPGTEARTHPAMPEKSTPWGGWPVDEGEAHEDHPLFADSNRSKTESEFWRYRAKSDVQGHGTGSSRE